MGKINLQQDHLQFLPNSQLIKTVVVLIASFTVAVIISYYTKYLPLFILLVASIYFLRLSYLAIFPFMFVAFISSDHIIQFRIPTPWGLLHPSIIIISFAILLTFFQKYISKSESFAFPKLVILTFLMFSLSLGLSVFLNGTDLDALMWLSILILGSGGVYFVSANHNNQKIAGMDLLKIVSSIATIIAVIAIIEYITGYNPFCAIHHSSEHWIRRSFEQPNLGHLIRARSSIGHPLVLSSFLVFVLPVSLYLAFQKDRKMFWIISTAIQYLGIFVTFSRSSYLLGIFLFLIYLVRFKVITINFKRFIFVSVFLIVVICIGLFLLYRHENLNAFLERVSFRTGKGSFLFRLNAWFLASEFIAKNPVVGAGIRRLPIFINKDLPLYPLTTFDNTFLDLFCEIGIVGLVSYILFILAPMISISKSNKANFASFLTLIVGIIMIYYGFIFNVVYHQIIWITYWTLQGLFLMIRNSNSYEVSK